MRSDLAHNADEASALGVQIACLLDHGVDGCESRIGCLTRLVASFADGRDGLRHPSNHIRYDLDAACHLASRKLLLMDRCIDAAGPLVNPADQPTDVANGLYRSLGCLLDRRNL